MKGSGNKSKRTITIIFFCVLAVFLVFIGRLTELMIVKGETYKKEALEQQTRDRLITPKRGTIFDRNGKPLKGFIRDTRSRI